MFLVCFLATGKFSSSVTYPLFIYNFTNIILSKIDKNGCKQINIDLPYYGWCRYAVFNNVFDTRVCHEKKCLNLALIINQYHVAKRGSPIVNIKF